MLFKTKANVKLSKITSWCLGLSTYENDTTYCFFGDMDYSGLFVEILLHINKVCICGRDLGQGDLIQKTETKVTKRVLPEIHQYLSDEIEWPSMMRYNIRKKWLHFVIIYSQLKHDYVKNPCSILSSIRTGVQISSMLKTPDSTILLNINKKLVSSHNAQMIRTLSQWNLNSELLALQLALLGLFVYSIFLPFILENWTGINIHTAHKLNTTYVLYVLTALILQIHNYTHHLTKKHIKIWEMD